MLCDMRLVLAPLELMISIYEISFSHCFTFFFPLNVERIFGAVLVTAISPKITENRNQNGNKHGFSRSLTLFDEHFYSHFVFMKLNFIQSL